MKCQQPTKLKEWRGGGGRYVGRDVDGDDVNIQASESIDGTEVVYIETADDYPASIVLTRSQAWELGHVLIALCERREW